MIRRKVKIFDRQPTSMKLASAECPPCSLRTPTVAELVWIERVSDELGRVGSRRAISIASAAGLAVMLKWY